MLQVKIPGVDFFGVGDRSCALKFKTAAVANFYLIFKPRRYDKSYPFASWA
jgi:hypothetical protein